MVRILFSLAFLAGGTLFGQGQYTLQIKSKDNPKTVSKLNYRKEFPEKISREKELQKAIRTLWDEGYLLASSDSMSGDSLNQIAWIGTGGKYEWVSLRRSAGDEAWLAAAGFREKDFRGKDLSYRSLSVTIERIITWAENNGYPFASVRLDSVHTDGLKVSAIVNLSMGPLVFIDSILIKGGAKISPAWLYSHIGIRPGSVYSEKKIREIAVRLKEIPFATAGKPYTVTFGKEKTKLTLWLEKKKASQFDGIAGVLPDNKTKKTTITGDVRLKLMNAFGRGELMDINWRKLQDQTQDLRTRFNYPFLFGTNYCADLAFKLYRRDTTFLEVNPVAGLEYRLSGRSSLKVFVDSKTLSLLSTAGLQGSTVTPSNADVNTVLYGLSLGIEKLDYRFNPTRGFTLNLSSRAGSRKILRNPNVNDSAYLSLDLNTSQFKGEGELQVFIPITGRLVLKTGAAGAAMFSENTFQNELYRLGGFRSLRGFDEESILASSWAVMTLEMRYILEQNSYAFLFSDGAWYEKNSSGPYQEDLPYSFGAGISFETRAGIISLSYALGSQKDNPILFRNGKIHVGLAALF